MAGVAVVVVTHDSGGTLAECLRRVLAADAVAELVVVDNASRDGAPDRAAFAHAADARFSMLRNAANPGFATACNQGARATRSRKCATSAAARSASGCSVRPRPI